MMAPLAASLIFAGMLVAIFSERLNRSIAAILGALLMVMVGRWLGFYSEQQAVQSIDLYTLGLLLGMMILVALLEPTGFFQYVAVWAGRLSRGRPLRLLVLLGGVTTLLSMALDNVTTAVLIAPVTVLICELLGLSPAPFLIAEALLANVGGVATLIGDPPNVLIAAAAGFSFNSFLTHTLPVALVAWPATILLLKYLFRDDLRQPPRNIAALAQMDPERAFTDRRTAWRVLTVLAGAFCLFFVHTRLDVTPAFIALLAATVALLWVQPKLSDVLGRVEWEVLIFFIAMFIAVGGLEAAGVLNALAAPLAGLGSLPPVLLGLLLLWLSAGLSAVVDNVPITIALIPMIQQMGASGINITPLWWALALGAGFGGNGTLIGSTAGMIIATLSQKTHTPVTAPLWNRRGLPVMLLTCLIASLIYWLFYPLFK